MIVGIADYVWILLQIAIGYNLILPVVLFLFSKLVRLNRRSGLENSSYVQPDYAIIVTAYIQTDLIPDTVRSIEALNYTNYHVYVVADNCDISALTFDNMRITVLRPEIVLGSNTKSHFYAIERFERAHDYITILDSDNLVDPEYLNKLNIYFNRGFQAVQGVRKPINLNTPNACLDAARDIYYHFYDGQILFNAGSSATLSGSGMAFTTQLYKDCLINREISGAGFDKVLQYEIVKEDVRIAFSKDAIVYDEKTAKSDQLIKQRSRWINTWFKYFHYGFSLLKSGILNFSLNKFLFGLILLRPPLFIFLLMSGAFLMINIFTSLTGTILWLSAMLCFVISFVIALALSDTNPVIYRSMIYIPKFIFHQLIALTRSRKANEIALTTIHEKRSDRKEI